MVKLELTTEDALAFRTFRKHQTFFELLIDKEVHLLSNGSATLNFAPNGTLSTVVLTQTVYRS